jgi:hypothetical protein
LQPAQLERFVVTLHIANPEVCALVKQLPEAWGVSIGDQAVKRAAREALAKREALDGRQAGLLPDSPVSR